MRRWSDLSPLVRHAAAAAAGVVTAAAVGSAATDPQSEWYRGLDKPSWQPPNVAFPIAWSLLYADIAATSGAVMARLEEEDRLDELRAYRRALAVNLVLNAGWSVVFFGAKRLRPAIPIAAALALSSADLSRRAGAVSPGYGVALSPYALWTSFATALNAEVARLNPQS